MRWLIFLLLLAANQAAADPRSHYMIHCMGCHLADGRGQPPEVPVLNAELARFTSTDAGRAYLVQVPGAAQALINDEELAAVINWMLQVFSGDDLPEDFRPFTGEEVTAYRQQILADPASFRATLTAK
ncbi:MAG: c-type cytochrome [Pseudomonadales bacterium]